MHRETSGEEEIWLIRILLIERTNQLFMACIVYGVRVCVTLYYNLYVA